MLKICNSHPAGIWAAISFHSPEACGGEGGDWQSIGWYRVESGACTVVYGNDLADVNRFWYYYAESDDGRVWKGDYNTYVKDPDSFNICEGIGSTAYTTVGFRQIDVGDSDNFTLTLRT